MSDTIELLEVIGSNAVLRHASSEELAQALEQANASDALKAAAKAGDGSLLSIELGPNQPKRVEHSPHAPGHEEPDRDHDHDHDHGAHPPHDPHTPDHGKPPHDR
jgi:hypothetical protein